MTDLLPITMKTKQTNQLTHGVSKDLLRAPSFPKLIDGHLLTLGGEGKFPRTVSYHSTQLKNFLWWCQQEGVPSGPYFHTSPQAFKPLPDEPSLNIIREA